MLVLASVSVLQGCKFGNSNKLESVRVVSAESAPVDDSGTLIASRCTRTQLALVGTFTKGGKQNFARQPATRWTSSKPAVISVSDGSGDVPKGRIVPHKLGTARITGDFMTLKDTLKVQVFHSEIRITPSASTLAIGTAQRMRAKEIMTAPSGVNSGYDHVRDITQAVTWHTQGPVSVDDETGLATAKPDNGVSSGIAHVTAKPDICTDLKATTTIRVTQATLTGLGLTSANSSGGDLFLPVGSEEPLKVLGHFSDGTTQNLTSQLVNQARIQLKDADRQNVFKPSAVSDKNVAAFLSAAPKPGMRHPSNVLTAGNSAGVTNVTATFDTPDNLQPVTKGHLTAHVLKAGLVDTGISPNQSTISVGSALQYKATATYDNSKIGTRDVTANPLVLYGSDSTGLVQLVNDVATPGLALANVTGKSGQASVTAGFYGVGGKVLAKKKALLNIDATTPVKVTVSDPDGCAGTLAVRAHCQLVAKAQFNGRSENVTQSAIWRSEKSGVASVDVGLNHGGVVGGLSSGSAKITASFRGVSSAPLKVTVP